MRIIQSLWSKPSNKKTNINPFDRWRGGWLQPKYYLMSWALSCLQLRKYYDEIELITDKEGEELLIKKLHLPYTKVSVILDELNEYHEDLWAIGKVYSYKIQEKPFLHVDGDVFIWDRFDSAIEKARFVSQSLDINLDFYYPIMKEVEEKLTHLPSSIKADRLTSRIIKACNAGVFGGTDVSFIQHYAAQAFQFVDINQPHLNKINIGYFNCIYEQYLSYCLAKEMNIEFSFVLDYAKTDPFNVANFFGIPSKINYAHPTNNAKKDEWICRQISNRLKLDYPEWHQRIEELIITEQYFPSSIQEIVHFHRQVFGVSLKSNFKRAISLIESLDSKSCELFFANNSNTSLASFIALVQRIIKAASVEDKERISDCMKLEMAIDKMAHIHQNKPEMQVNEFLIYKSSQELFNRSDDYFMNQTFVFNKEAILVWTKFNWSENDHLVSTEGGFVVLLWPDSSKIVNELWLGKEIRILDQFKITQNISQALNFLMSKENAYLESEADKDAFRAYLTFKVKEFISSGVLISPNR